MMKYENLGTTISVDLGNGYSVIGMANYNKEQHKYFVSLWLRDNKIPMLDLIEKAENIASPVSDRKTIKANMAEYIENCHSEGMFDYYIKRYQYQQKCFDAVNEKIEFEV